MFIVGEALAHVGKKELGIRYPDTDDAMFDKTLDILNNYWNKNL